MIITVSSSTHAWCQAMRLAEPIPFIAAELRPLIRVDHDVLLRLASPNLAFNGIHATPFVPMLIGRVLTMAQLGRPGLSAFQKADAWQQWKIGHSLSDIGRALGKHAGSIHRVVASNGGIIPVPRQRSRWALTLAEREEISRGLAAGLSMRQMAARIGRPPSTVSREIARHGGRREYRATVADAEAWEQACRPKPCRLAVSPNLRKAVAHKLSLDWSPAQISGWLVRTFPDDDRMHVSHETIYRSLFIQARGVLKKELTRHLRSGRMMRHSKRASTEGAAPGPDQGWALHPRSASRRG